MKRFTATEKWDKVWFQELTVLEKIFWNFLCDNCDLAGVWEPNFRQASFQIGAKVSIETMAVFSGKIVLLKSGSYWIKTFIEFQYGKLSKDCRPHARIFALIEKHGLDEPETITLSDTLSDRVSDTLQEIDKDKDKEEDKEGRGCKGKPDSVEEVIRECATRNQPEFVAREFWNFYESNGWKVGKNKMASWMGALAGWISRNHAKPNGNGYAHKSTIQIRREQQKQREFPENIIVPDL